MTAKGWGEGGNGELTENEGFFFGGGMKMF